MKNAYVKYACGDCGECFDTKEEAIDCCGETLVNQVSSCCEEEIGEKVKTDYPLGGSTWGIDYGVPCCTKCGKEIEE